MDEATVRHVARLARLELTDAEAKRFAADMTRITEYVSALANVNVQGAEMTVHPVAERNQWRQDEPAPGVGREQAVANAPESEQNFFKVPPVIE
ncbi:MAG: Asp-tRNA(Asn)/Glu-tRNA(Gln) amidotransferase subunit GatC [Planctomycetes bacterium]|nr:Asp-tRNA(Asn)/Glu-tRNA(Gln) amidotransferase subunit GatC [Planctomycetota bacterium]MCW8136212.1 Asp-tRNA(Asn)/Glu-tRNA(Gln) amidotransferase subunit GatC [Planctomycetota bacterium]